MYIFLSCLFNMLPIFLARTWTWQCMAIIIRTVYHFHWNRPTKTGKSTIEIHWPVLFRSTECSFQKTTWLYKTLGPCTIYSQSGYFRSPKRSVITEIYDNREHYNRVWLNTRDSTRRRRENLFLVTKQKISRLGNASQLKQPLLKLNPPFLYQNTKPAVTYDSTKKISAVRLYGWKGQPTVPPRITRPLSLSVLPVECTATSTLQFAICKTFKLQFV
jgi:hypothetical protein